MQEDLEPCGGDVREAWSPRGRNRTLTDWHPTSRSVACCSNPDCTGPQSKADSRTTAKAPSPKYQSKATISASLTLDSFLAGLKWLKSEELISFFAKNAHFIDTSGKRWNREEIYSGFETLFAPYAKKNASYVVEATLAESSDVFVANVLWKNALLASEQRAWMHRMSVVLIPEAEEWAILLAQVTPVQSF